MCKLIAERLCRVNKDVEAELRKAHAFALGSNYGPAIALADVVADKTERVCNELRELVRSLERRGYPSAPTIATFAGRYDQLSKSARELCDNFKERLAGSAAKPEQS